MVDTGTPPAVLFWKHVLFDDCWMWTGAGRGGKAQSYGKFTDAQSGKTWAAHRFAFESLVGPIPAGLVLDHLCRNTLCVNPAHLEIVTQAENNRREDALVTHCPQGHAYAGRNLSYHGRSRRCLTCHRMHEQARRKMKSGEDVREHGA